MIYEGLHGDTYKSMKKLANAYGISHHTLLDRIKKGISIKEALTTPVNNKRKTYKGLHKDTYQTLMGLARAYGISYSTLRYRIKIGMSIKEALTTPENSKHKEYKGLHNDTYKTIADLARAYGISYDILISRKNNKGLSLQEALKEILDLPYEGLHGDRYKTKLDLAKAYGISYGMLKKTLSKGMNTKEAIEYVLSKQNRIYYDTFGNNYKQFKQMAISWGVNSNTLDGRLKHGIEMCVALVAKDLVQIEFIGLDGKARYKLNWSDEPQTARQVIEHYRPDLLSAYDKHNPTGKYEPYEGE